MNIELVLRGTLATIVKILWEYLSIQSFQYRIFLIYIEIDVENK